MDQVDPGLLDLADDLQEKFRVFPVVLYQQNAKGGSFRFHVFCLLLSAPGQPKPFFLFIKENYSTIQEQFSLEVLISLM